ncbi:MAG: DNA-binding protein [Rhizobacter sp.]|nr:DNA-binding protein [Rhizobacter sp.]
MTALATTPNADSPLASGLHVAFESFSKALVANVNALIAQQLKRQAASRTIEKKVADAMPALLEQAFIADFLQDKESARHRRAILAHLLSTAELQSFVDPAADRASTASADDTAELTSEAAAKLLHVSRTHLNTLVDTGQLGAVRRTAGGHRRISRADVLRYKAASKERQAKGLDAMVQATERLGLYDNELDGRRRSVPASSRSSKVARDGTLFYESEGSVKNAPAKKPARKAKG